MKEGEKGKREDALSQSLVGKKKRSGQQLERFRIGSMEAFRFCVFKTQKKNPI